MLLVVELLKLVFQHVPNPGEIRTDGVGVGSPNLYVIAMTLNVEVIAIEVILLSSIEEHEVILNEESGRIELNLCMQEVQVLDPATIEDRFADPLVRDCVEVADRSGGEGSHDELSFY